MSPDWHDGPIVMFDLETTGVDPHRDRIVTAAINTFVPRVGMDRQSWLVNPGIPIPEGASAIHGITTARAQEDGTDAAAGVHEIAATLLDRMTRHGAPVVGHNVSYDLTMLWCELLRHGDPLAERVRTIKPVIDTMVLDKWLDPYRPKGPTARRPDPARCGSRTLIDTCRVYGVTLSRDDAHGADADATAAGQLAWRIAVRYPGAQGNAHVLHDWQIEEKRHQAESFAKWLTKQGKPDDVARDWPIQATPDGWDPSQLPAAREEAVSA